LGKKLPMKKGCLIATAAVVVLIVIGLAAIFLAFGLTRGAVNSADNFLGLVGSGKIAEAYESASATLRSQQTLEAFAKSVTDLGLTDFSSVSWSSRKTENDRGHLEGSARTRAGGTIPLNVELVKESGTWKVISLSAPQSGMAATQSGGKQVPSDDKAKALILASLLDFNKALQDQDFSNFHASVSRAWQEQITPDKLKEVFQGFIDKKIDISSITRVEPVLTDAPQLNSDGLLVMEGYYPTQPLKVNFKLKYIYEHPAWKLFGINVNVN
jgi:hypothetical protein